MRADARETLGCFTIAFKHKLIKLSGALLCRCRMLMGYTDVDDDDATEAGDEPEGEEEDICSKVCQWMMKSCRASTAESACER